MRDKCLLRPSFCENMSTKIKAHRQVFRNKLVQNRKMCCADWLETNKKNDYVPNFNTHRSIRPERGYTKVSCFHHSQSELEEMISHTFCRLIWLENEHQSFFFPTDGKKTSVVGAFCFM